MFSDSRDPGGRDPRRQRERHTKEVFPCHHTRARARAHTHTHVHTHTYIHITCTCRVQVLVYIHTCMRTSTCIHTLHVQNNRARALAPHVCPLGYDLTHLGLNRVVHEIGQTGPLALCARGLGLSNLLCVSSVYFQGHLACRDRLRPNSLRR
jgi:hypothetical protein